MVRMTTGSFVGLALLVRLNILLRLATRLWIVATGDGLTPAGLWAAAVFIFFSHCVKVIIELYTLF